ncbi:MAG: carboxypeptidase-like regulatory domain-containing protein, partial [Bacteroidota bacterium]
VRSGAVADSEGNGVAKFERVVTTPDRNDKAAVRLAAFLPETRLPADSARTLRPDQRAGVRFSLPPDSARLGGVVVTSGGEPIPFTTRATTDGLGTEVEIDGEVRTFSLGVPVADSVQTRRYRRPSPSETGELAGRVTGADSPVIVEAVPASGEPFRTMTDSTGAFRLDGLPPGDYRLRFVVDTDGSGAWSGGSLAPYSPPERISFGRDAQTVRARFETDVGEIALDAP